jgi:O-antigen/teichoic acid export membrane protein
MSQLKKGVILSYITIILTNSIGLLLTPFIIQKLGDSEYGLYTLIGSLVGYISVLDFGLNNSIVRFVSKYKAQNDKKGEENFLAATMLIYAFISFLIVLFGVILYFNIDNFFEKLSTQEISKAKIMFVILIFNLAITLPGGAYGAICSAYEKFVFPRALNIIKYVIRSIMLVSLLTLGGDSISIVVLDTVMNILIIVLEAYYVYKILKVVFKLHFFEFSLIKEIFSYSVWIFVFAMVGQFQWKAGQVILGVMTGTTAVAIYGVGIMLGTYYGAFSTAISGVFLPRATKMTIQNSSGNELTTMMIRIGRISLVVLLLILGGFLLFGRQFVHLWVGDTYKNSWLIAVIIMIAYTVPLVQAFANSILEAKKKFSFKALVYISFISLGTLFGALLVNYFGEVGIIIGTTVGWTICQIIMNIYYKRVVNIQILRFYKELSKGLLLTFLLTLIFGLGINYIPGNNWYNLIVKISVYAFIFIFLMFRFGLNEVEKEMFKNSIPFRNYIKK